MSGPIRRVLARRRFDNRRFWNDRYRTDPDLGSGVGSRGELAVNKRALVEGVWADHGHGSVLDVGFGDLTVLDPAVFKTYTGLDVSDVAVERARQRYPQHTFLNVDFGARAEPDVPAADVVLCLDVLIHQFDPNGYRRMVHRLVARAQRVGLVSGYDNEPKRGGPIIAYHEPLSKTLRDAGVTDATKVSGYRGLAVLRFGPRGA
jgi:2-polyprenyl-3-methyl-5-hydroxy-6-metoxy-1,4-benzoquinol methylase